MKNKQRKKEILIIDDEKDIRDLLSGIIEDEGYVTRLAANSEQAIDALYKRKPDIVLVDIWLHNSKMDGLELLLEIKRMYHDLLVIVMSGHGNIETAVVAIKRGAYDYLEKPFKIDKMLLTISRAIEIVNLKHENVYLKMNQKATHDQLVGISPAIVKIKNQIHSLVNSTARILIHGEKATGKTFVAKILHQESNQHKEVLEEINLLHMTDAEVADFLFGYELKGEISVGLFERVKTGTVILKGITNLSDKLEKELLNMLQKGYFYRVKGRHKIAFECRLITILSDADKKQRLSSHPTSKALIDMLGVVTIAMPNLSQRRDDISELTNLFVNEYTHEKKRPIFTKEAMDVLKTRNWPSNLESLKNFIHKILILYENYNYIDANMIINNENDTQDEGRLINTEMVIQYDLRKAREIFERQYIKDQIKRFSYNISQTSKFMGLDRSALHRKMKSLKIEF